MEILTVLVLVGTGVLLVFAAFADRRRGRRIKHDLAEQAREQERHHPPGSPDA